MSTTIESRLKALMKNFNLNVLDLEKSTGVPSSTLYRLLQNKNGNPTIEILKKLSSFFQVTVSQLIGEEPMGIKQIPLIPAAQLLSFVNKKSSHAELWHCIPVEFSVNKRCFATEVQDDLMEPFILMNSIVIVDPEKQMNHRDFVLYFKGQENLPFIRQIIKDGTDIYLKTFNTSLPVDLIKVKKTSDFHFIGTIIHYRTNLFSLEKHHVDSYKASQTQ